MRSKNRPISFKLAWLDRKQYRAARRIKYRNLRHIRAENKHDFRMSLKSLIKNRKPRKQRKPMKTTMTYNKKKFQTKRNYAKFKHE
jgi:hypothetical protein